MLYICWKKIDCLYNIDDKISKSMINETDQAGFKMQSLTKPIQKSIPMRERES